LSTDEYLLRKALLDCLAAAPGSATAADAGAALGWPPVQTAVVLAALAAKKLVAQDDEGRLRYAYPVSGAATDHRVTLADGRTLYAMCAIDALGCFFEFGQPLQIDACCHVCGAPVHIAVRSATEAVSLPPDVYATHVDLNKYDDWAANT
jgi:hypothetical protein